MEKFDKQRLSRWKIPLIFLFLLILGNFITHWKDFSSIYFENLLIVHLLFPFVLCIVFLLLICSKKIDIILQVSAIGLAILIFFFQAHIENQKFFLSDSEMRNYLVSESVENCILALQLHGIDVRYSDYFVDYSTPDWQRFLPDGYLINFNLIASEFGTSTATDLPATVKGMLVANRLLDQISTRINNNVVTASTSDIGVNLANLGSDIAHETCRIAGISIDKFDLARVPYHATSTTL